MAPAAAFLAAETAGRGRFVDLDVNIWAWVGLTVLLLSLLGLDLYRHRNARVPSLREALTESATWVACGLAFSLVILWAYGSGAFGEYLSGYLTEKALSVDNVFVWSILFTAMSIPVALQHRVLFWGVFGALTLRAAFIFTGTALLERFEVLLVAFGAFLIITGVRLLRHRHDEGDDGSTAGLGLLGRIMPVSETLDGQRFFTRMGGRRAATPLLAALVVVEVTDVIFAVDSVPAILALSHEQFLVFSSNAFAILGLRAMYFLLADARERFHYLNHALGTILIFVGVKMVAAYFGHHLDTWVSLGVIMALLLAAIVASRYKERRLTAARSAAVALAADGGGHEWLEPVDVLDTGDDPEIN
ncbi:MAG: TerC/Alx family metal homeostasis membrane protein [Acidimicrobiia bacterium]|nr:TerC/Alx family metal homeostasis membrane protein [Acidimicrobiia bacterium]